MAGRSLFFARAGIKIRKVVQIFFFMLIGFISINHTLAESGKGIAFLSDASLHALCPFGGVVTIYQYATVGTFVQKIHESSFVLMAIGFVLALLFGPVFCGWVCPLGTVQEFFSGIGTQTVQNGASTASFRPSWTGCCATTRYIVLAWVVYMTAASGTLMFSNIDPYFALFNLWSQRTGHRRRGLYW